MYVGRVHNYIYSLISEVRTSTFFMVSMVGFRKSWCPQNEEGGLNAYPLFGRLPRIGHLATQK